MAHRGSVTKEELLRMIRRRGVKRVPKDIGTGKPFARLEAKLATRPGVYSPGGLAGTITRRKYGRRIAGELSAYGRRRRA